MWTKDSSYHWWQAGSQTTLTKPLQFVLLREAGVVKDYRAAVPMGHRLKAMAPSTTVLIEKELNKLRGIKSILVLVIELEKLTANVEQLYDENVEPDMIRITAHQFSIKVRLNKSLMKHLQKSWSD